MSKREIIFGLFVALLIALLLSPFASSWPDGLERVAEDKGFLEKGEIEPVLVSPIPDYAWPGIDNEAIATSLAGVVGTLIVFGLGFGIAAILKKNNL